MESGAGVQTQDHVSAQIIARVMTTTIHQSVIVSVFSNCTIFMLYLLFQAIFCIYNMYGASFLCCLFVCLFLLGFFMLVVVVAFFVLFFFVLSPPPLFFAGEGGGGTFVLVYVCIFIPTVSAYTLH